MASVEAAEANMHSARIELGYTKVHSPINGIIGKTEVYPGDYVGKGIGNVVMNEVSRIDTILVNFHLPEEKYLEIARFISEADPSVKRDNQPRTALVTTQVNKHGVY